MIYYVPEIQSPGTPDQQSADFGQCLPPFCHSVKKFNFSSLLSRSVESLCLLLVAFCESKLPFFSQHKLEKILS
jgi:hypothetical protein